MKTSFTFLYTLNSSIRRNVLHNVPLFSVLDLLVGCRNGAFLGLLHMIPVDQAGRFPRSRLTPFSFVKILMCSYEKAGQPSYQDFGFYKRDLSRDENFPI